MLQDRVGIQRRLRRRCTSGVIESLLGRAKNSRRLRDKRLRNRPKPTYPDTLPITDRKDEILSAIRHNPVVVLAGETGSGKSTQLPKICLEAGRGKDARIGVTQPRRVAALS